MGLIKKMAVSFGSMPAIKVGTLGYGLGKRETGRLNALRVFIGDTAEELTDIPPARVAVLETNIDDMSPEILAYTADRLMEAGALDVFFTPIYMKKGRPAYMLSVLSSLENEASMLHMILKETSTLGVRRTLADRYCMERETVIVDTGIGSARIKIARMGDIQKASPEYEDCKRLAQESSLSLQDVISLAMDRYSRDYKNGDK
jgi:uncharacterized protein (DUF111 family)